MVRREKEKKERNEREGEEIRGVGDWGEEEGVREKYQWWRYKHETADLRIQIERWMLAGQITCGVTHVTESLRQQQQARKTLEMDRIHSTTPTRHPTPGKTQSHACSKNRPPKSRPSTPQDYKRKRIQRRSYINGNCPHKVPTNPVYSWAVWGISTEHLPSEEICAFTEVQGQKPTHACTPILANHAWYKATVPSSLFVDFRRIHKTFRSINNKSLKIGQVMWLNLNSNPSVWLFNRQLTFEWPDLIFGGIQMGVLKKWEFCTKMCFNSTHDIEVTHMLVPREVRENTWRAFYWFIK